MVVHGMLGSCSGGWPGVGRAGCARNDTFSWAFLFLECFAIAAHAGLVQGMQKRREEDETICWVFKVLLHSIIYLTCAGLARSFVELFCLPLDLDSKP